MADYKDIHFMGLALEEAKKAYDMMEVPVGAVIVKEGEVIARAHNTVETDKNPLSHAELIAIDKASRNLGAWRLLDTTIYITLEPCAMCAGAIVASRIKRVVIGADDLKRGCCGTVLNLLDFEKFNHRCEIERGVLKKDCSEILSDFFAMLRKKD